MIKLLNILKEIKEDSWENLKILLIDYYNSVESEEDFSKSIDSIVKWGIDNYEEDDPLRISLENNNKLFDFLLINNINDEINIGDFNIVFFIKNNKIFIKFKHPEDLTDYNSSSKITGGNNLILNVEEDTTLSTKYSLQIDKNIVFTQIKGKDNLNLQISPSSKGFKYLNNVENILKKFNIKYTTKSINGMGDKPTWIGFNLKDNPNIKINPLKSSKTQNKYTPVYNMGGTPNKLKVEYFDKGDWKKVYLHIKPYVLAQGEAELEDELIINIATKHLELIESLLEKRNISYVKQTDPYFSNIYINKKYLDITKLDPSKAGLLMNSVATGKYFELYKKINNKTTKKQQYLDALDNKILKDMGYKPFPSIHSDGGDLFGNTDLNKF